MGRKLQVICLATLSFLSYPLFVPQFQSPDLSFSPILHSLFSSGSSLTSIFSPILTRPFSPPSFTYCPRLLTIIISLYLSSHLALRVHSIKTKTHLNSGGIATDATAAYAHVCCGAAERFRTLLQLTYMQESYSCF